MGEPFEHETGTYEVCWSPEDGEYVATIDRFPSLSWLAATRADAVNGLYRLVLEVEADADIAAGRTTTYDSFEQLMQSLGPDRTTP